jgi:hypothetical protein
MHYMHTKHTPKLGTNDVEARWSSETLIENLSEAVGATSPMSGNYALEGDVTTHDNDTVSVPNVTPEMRARVSLTCDGKTPTEKIMTADEYMKKHIGETPKAENKFSLASLKSKSEDAVPKSNTKPGTVTVGRPNDDLFIRTSVKSEEWAAFDFIELKTEKKLYLLTPDVLAQIASLNEDRAQVVIKTVKKRLIYSLTRQGDSFLWPITIMDGDNDWIDSANVSAKAAKESWIRVVSNQAAGRYDYVTSPLSVQPRWPSMSYEEAVLKAFRGKIIDSMGHDVIQQLLGEG